MIAVVSDKIVTGQFPNTNQQHYRSCQLALCGYAQLHYAAAFAAWRLSE
jgi:hypothetical protein